MCNCIELINKSMKDRGYNTELDIPFGISPTLNEFIHERVKVATKKADESIRRGRPISVFASFCPFCGESYKVANKNEPG